MTGSLSETRARLDLLALFSRLLAAEIDSVLYRRLVTLMDDQSPALMSPQLAHGDEQASITELSVEFCRLFVGPGPECPPYPSSYGVGRLLRGGPERQFGEFLAAHDLRVDVTGPFKFLSEHHFAVQLAAIVALGQVALDETQAVAIRGQAASSVSELSVRHLLPALPDFADALVNSARFPPYTTVGAILVPTLDNTIADLSDLYGVNLP